MFNKDSDYSMIQTMIDFLKQIVELIMKLFSGVNGTTTTTEAPSEEPSTAA